MFIIKIKVKKQKQTNKQTNKLALHRKGKNDEKGIFLFQINYLEVAKKIRKERTKRKREKKNKRDTNSKIVDLEKKTVRKN